MDKQKTSLLNNSLLWFGAAVSIAEIMTGALFAPLGLKQGLAAIILGHLIGGLLLYLAGLIGADSGMSAMESVRLSFGEKGSYLFSILNILQLVGWTAVMIIGGARAIAVIANPVLGLQGNLLWCLLIGLLIILWLIVGLQSLGKVNVLAVGALFILTIVLSTVVFRGNNTVSAAGGSLSFGAAVELSVAMPLSWLPLISDYTKEARKPRAATLVSSISYFIGSCWMYLIGLGAALFANTSDVAQIMFTAGMGLAGILIIILSTVTTTFLDVYSAGVSFTNLSPRFPVKGVAVVVCLLGTLIAMFTPIEQYENFLYFIGSVFAPMTAILISDYFILKEDHAASALNLTNLLLWLTGFIIYRNFMRIDTALGSTIPVMFIIILLSVLVKGAVRLLCLKKSWKM